MEKSVEIIEPKDLHSPIPLDISINGWQQKEIQENNEPTMGVGFCTGNEFRGLFSASAYGPDLNIHDCYGDDGVENGLTACFMREGVAKKLLEAEKLLPKNHHFVVFDAWRSKDVQAALYKQFSDKLMQQHPVWPAEKIAEETQKFVSLPSTDPTKPSTHNTGGAIDLTIVSLPDGIEVRINEIDELIFELDATGKAKEIYDLELERHNIFAQNLRELNFGTAFDCADEKAAPDYYEKLALKRELITIEIEARDNRRLLYNVMQAVGGMPFPYEWWHFNFGNQMAAVTSGEQFAVYGASDLSAENLEYEKTLKEHRKGVLFTNDVVKANNPDLIKLISRTQMGRVVLKAVERSGSYRDTSLSQIEPIQPPDDIAA